MKLAIMQPYFLPYIGYYQLISAVDTFVIYDNIKYSKKSWVNRNRLLVNSEATTFSLPLQKDSDSLDVVERKLASDFNRSKLLNKFRGAYRKAPYFESTYSLLEEIVNYQEDNLFRYIYHSIKKTCAYLGINTEIQISSEIAIDHNLKAKNKVFALCQALGADTYINAIGGAGLYSFGDFRTKGIRLCFLRPHLLDYHQFGGAFVPGLSIVDASMFNQVDRIQLDLMPAYDLLEEV